MGELVNCEAQWRTKLWTSLKESGASKPLRESMAASYGASADEITLSRNATDGLATLVFGVDLKPGDEVVISSEDYGYVIETIRQREKRDGVRLVLTDLPTLKDLHASDEEIVAAFEGRFTSRSACSWSATSTPTRG